MSAGCAHDGRAGPLDEDEVHDGCPDYNSRLRDTIREVRDKVDAVERNLKADIAQESTERSKNIAEMN